MSLRRFGPLGKRQRQVLNDMATVGRWRPDRSVGHLTINQTRAVAQTLTERRLAAYYGDGPALGYWALTPKGYAWLVADAAGDLDQVGASSLSLELVATRIQHLGSLARLSKDGPVNWRGEQT